MSDKKCVVCSAPAEVFCHNDDAYLCALCDVTVHHAHPLAASHTRVPIGKPDKEESLDSLFEVPTVPDALLGSKEEFEPKLDEVRPLELRTGCDEVSCICALLVRSERVRIVDSN